MSCCEYGDELLCNVNRAASVECVTVFREGLGPLELRSFLDWRYGASETSLSDC